MSITIQIHIYRIGLATGEPSNSSTLIRSQRCPSGIFPHPPLVILVMQWPSSMRMGCSICVSCAVLSLRLTRANTHTHSSLLLHRLRRWRTFSVFIFLQSTKHKARRDWWKGPRFFHSFIFFLGGGGERGGVSCSFLFGKEGRKGKKEERKPGPVGKIYGT